MKYYLSSFGLHNPFIKIEFADHLVYPIANEFRDGFDLDYGMLLVGESFMIDKDTFEFIINDDRGFLSPMANSLKRLNSEGFLELLDLKSIVDKNKSDLIFKSELLANHYRIWMDNVRGQWSILELTRENFVNNYGDKGKTLINGNHFTLVNAIFNVFGELNQDLIDRYHHVVFSQRKHFKKVEENIFKELIKPLVCHILIHDLVRHITGRVILDWDDGAPFYDTLYATRWDRNEIEESIPNRSRQILNLILPQLKPNMVDVLIKFIRDKKASSSLRNQIIQMIQSGEKVDFNWLSKYQNEIIKYNLVKEKVMKKVRLGSNIAGLAIPGSGFITDILTEGAAILIENGVEGSLSTESHIWYYAMQDIFNSNKK